MPNLPSRSRRGSASSMVSIDESEQLTIDFALLKTEEKLKQDIDAAFSGEMTDFDLDGEVDQIFTSAPTSPKKRAGELDNVQKTVCIYQMIYDLGSWTSVHFYRNSDDSRNESPSKFLIINPLINLSLSVISFFKATDLSEEQELTEEDLKFLRRSSIGCSGIVIEEMDD